VEDQSLRGRVLPIGGPGPPITPKEQGEALFALLNRAPRFTHVPILLIDAIIRTLAFLGHLSPKLRSKAELARIGRYYATESMLVLNAETRRYDAEVTPSTGTETLLDHYARLINGKAQAQRADHSVF
jgi:divinyl chlorophyllide a 8-vinyl-reductase